MRSLRVRPGGSVPRGILPVAALLLAALLVVAIGGWSVAIAVALGVGATLLPLVAVFPLRR